MRNAAIIAFCAVTFAGCYGGPAGELVGVYPREDWVQVNPYGMNYIHYGSFTMGPSDQDVMSASSTRAITTEIGSTPPLTVTARTTMPPTPSAPTTEAPPGSP